MSARYAVFLKVAGVVCLALLGVGVLIGRWLFGGGVSQLPLLVDIFFGGFLLIGLFYGVATVYFYIERRQKENQLIGADSRGLLRLNIDGVIAGEYDKLAAVALMSYHQQQLAFAQRSGQVPTTYHDKRTVTYGQGGQGVEVLPPFPQNGIGQLPEGLTLSHVLPVSGVSLEAITLAVGLDGQPIRVPAHKLMHTSLLGRTGDGKSICLRGLLTQLLAAGAKCLMADPHFTPYDADKDEDWQPIANRLYMPAAYQIEQIKELVQWFIVELERRLERRRRGETCGKPLFLAIDEFPSIVAEWKEATDTLARILREGRKVGCYLITSSQSLLVKDTGGSTSVRDQYRTVAYMGGDESSARKLLGVNQKELVEILGEDSLGQGVAVLRSPETRYPQKVRIPLTRNEDLYELLDTSPAPSPKLPESLPNPVEKSPVAPSLPSNTPKMDRAKEMLLQGTSQHQIIKQLWGVSGGRKYQQAARELNSMIAQLILTGGQS